MSIGQHTHFKTPNMPNGVIKTQTAKGASVAPFTMRVKFKPEFQSVNKLTGELCQQWTYRCDLENAKLAHSIGKGFTNEIDVLAYLYVFNNHKYSEVKMFNNSKAGALAMFYHECKGRVIYPTEPEKLERFTKWLKRIQSLFPKSIKL